MGRTSPDLDDVPAARRASVVLVALVEVMLLAAVLVVVRWLPGAAPAQATGRERIEIAAVPEPGPEPAAVPAGRHGDVHVELR